jgi:hypothetical protein
MNSLLSERSDSIDTIELQQNFMAGYLYKRSSSGNWQRRYFETNGSHLTYYKTHKMTKLLAALSMPQVGSIKLVTDDDVDSQASGAVFQLDLKDRHLHLRAANHDEAKKWINVLVALRDGSLRESGTFLPGEMRSSDSALDSLSVSRTSSSTDREASATIWKTNRFCPGVFCAPCCSYLSVRG